MAGVKFKCPHCDEIIFGASDRAGDEITCLHCMSPVIIPHPPKEAKEGILVGGDGEVDVFEIRPTRAAYLGTIAMGALCIIAALALCVLSVLHKNQWYLVGTALGLLLGGILLIKVWITLKSRHYRLTDERFFVTTGLIARKINELELFRIKDVLVEQSLIQRVLGYGTITIVSSDENTPTIRMEGIPRPVEIKEKIRNQYRAARKHEKVAAAEFMT